MTGKSVAGKFTKRKDIQALKKGRRPEMKRHGE